MKWPREKLAQKKTIFTANEIQKDIKNHCTMIGYHLNCEVGSKAEDFKSCPVTRSSVEDHDAWIIDRDAIDIRVTDTHILGRYTLEKIVTCKNNTRLLLLVNVDDDDRLFRGRERLIFDEKNSHEKNWEEGLLHVWV